MFIKKNTLTITLGERVLSVPVTITNHYYKLIAIYKFNILLFSNYTRITKEKYE